MNYDKVNQRLSNHPFWSEKWSRLTKEQRIGYYYYVIDLIDNHAWLGTPIGTPVQEHAFPRIINCQLIYWQDDETAPVNHTQFSGGVIVLPYMLISEAIGTLLQQKDTLKQQGLKKTGIESVTVGPIKQDISGKQSTFELPLPEPLWSNLKQYSKLNIQHIPFAGIKTARS